MKTSGVDKGRDNAVLIEFMIRKTRDQPPYDGLTMDFLIRKPYMWVPKNGPNNETS